MTAMLARELVKPAFQATRKPEVIAAERQYLAAENRIVEPVRQPKFDRNHAAVGGMLLDYLPRIDDSEPLALADTVSPYVRSDPGSRETLESLLKLIVIASAGVTIGAYQQIVSGQSDSGAEILAVRV